jgi:hypothetical protein
VSVDVRAVIRASVSRFEGKPPIRFFKLSVINRTAATMHRGIRLPVLLSGRLARLSGSKRLWRADIRGACGRTGTGGVTTTPLGSGAMEGRLYLPVDQHAARIWATRTIDSHATSWPSLASFAHFESFLGILFEPQMPSHNASCSFISGGSRLPSTPELFPRPSVSTLFQRRTDRL